MDPERAFDASLDRFTQVVETRLRVQKERPERRRARGHE
jgi:hypothetical protein